MLIENIISIIKDVILLILFHILFGSFLHSLLDHFLFLKILLFYLLLHLLIFFVLLLNHIRNELFLKNVPVVVANVAIVINKRVHLI